MKYRRVLIVRSRCGIGAAAKVSLDLVAEYKNARGLCRYTFENTCLEQPGLKLSNGAVRIFLNTRGKTEWEGNRTLVEFLRYVEDPAAPVESPEVILVRKRVAEVKRNEETEARYMTSLTYVREIYEDGRVDGEAEGEARGRAAGRKEGIAEGRKKGRAEGQIQDILDLLSDLGTVPDSLAGRILEEKDTVTLRRWIRLAAKAESHTDFKENM